MSPEINLFFYSHLCLCHIICELNMSVVLEVCLPLRLSLYVLCYYVVNQTVVIKNLNIIAIISLILSVKNVDSFS